MSRARGSWRSVRNLMPAAMLAAAASTNCSSDSLTAADSGLLGVWTLTQINGTALPVNWGGVCGQDGKVLSASNVAIAGSMTFLETKHEYQISLIYDHQCPGGGVTHLTTSGAGNWQSANAGVVTISPGSGNISGSAATTAIVNGRISFPASLPSIDGAAQNAVPVVATLTFAR